MAKTPLRMKNKMLTKIHLDGSGAMVLEAVKASSMAASLGVSAQPAGPLEAEANAGNPGPLPSSLSLPTEPGTGGPAERTAPATMPEADTQPAEKDLLQSPAKLTPLLTEEATTPLAGPSAPAPNETVPSATADSVLKTETSNDSLSLPSIS